MSSRILVAYTTSEGQTAHVARFIAETLAADGGEVQLADLRRESPEPDRFDAVLIGGSVHAGKFQGELAGYVKANRERLNALPSWLFAISLSEAIEGSPFGHEHAVEQIETFLEATGWKPRGTASVAGAVKYRDYSWPKRLGMRTVLAKSGGETDTSRNWEYTNWEGVREFAEGVARTVRGLRAPALSRP